MNNSYSDGIPKYILEELNTLPKYMTSIPSIRRYKREVKKPIYKRSKKWKWFILLIQKAVPGEETHRLLSAYISIMYYGRKNVKANFKIPRNIRAMAIDQKFTIIT